MCFAEIQRMHRTRRLEVGECENAAIVHCTTPLLARLVWRNVEPFLLPVFVVPPALGVVGRVVIRNEPSGSARIIQEAASLHRVGFFDQTGSCGDFVLALARVVLSAGRLPHACVPRAYGREVIRVWVGMVSELEGPAVLLKCFERVLGRGVEVEAVLRHVGFAWLNKPTDRVAGLHPQTGTPAWHKWLDLRFLRRRAVFGREFIQPSLAHNRIGDTCGIAKAHREPPVLERLFWESQRKFRCRFVALGEVRKRERIGQGEPSTSHQCLQHFLPSIGIVIPPRET